MYVIVRVMMLVVICLLFVDVYAALSFFLFCHIVFAIGVFSSNPIYVLRRTLMPWVFAALSGLEMHYVTSADPGILLLILCWVLLPILYAAGLFAPIHYSKQELRGDTGFIA